MIKEDIIKFLEDNEDDIMTCCHGHNIDEYDKRYAEVYCYEWDDAKHDIALTVAGIRKSKNIVTAEGFAYIIISYWSGVIVWEHEELDIEGLINICKKVTLIL